MKIRNCARACAAALVLFGGSTQAALVDAYEDTSLGTSWQHTVNFTSITGTSADVSIDTFYFNNIVPILKLFETDGTGGTVTLTETITNTGSTPWSSWSEGIWAEYQTNDANTYGPFNPSSYVSWSSVSANVAGTSSIDPLTGLATFVFNTPLAQGQSVTLDQETYELGLNGP